MSADEQSEKEPEKRANRKNQKRSKKIKLKSQRKNASRSKYIQVDVNVGVHQSLASFIVVVMFYDMIEQIRCTEVSNRIRVPLHKNRRYEDSVVTSSSASANVKASAR
jgi:hypothetical protein